jgi:hypothetical protein
MYWSLIKKFFKEKGRFPIGKELDDIKKLSGDMEFRQKLLRFPEEKITDYTKDRPTEGPKAKVEKFPKENIVRKQSDLIEGRINKLESNNEEQSKSLAELVDELGVLAEESKKTTTSDFLRDYFDLPNPQQKRNVTELNGIELFGDETFEELDIINKTGKHPRDKKAEGGRIGLKFGFFKKKPKKIKGESENLRKPIERLEKSKQLSKKGEFMEDGETPDYEYYAELLNDAEDSRGFNIQGDETIEVLEDRLKQLKDEEAYWYGQYKAGKLDPEPGEINRSRLTFLKNKSKEAEMSGDKRLITQDELEELDSLEKRFEYLDLEEKAQDVNRKLTNSEIERLKEINDSGYVDFQIEMDRINRNKKATGGRIQSKKSAGLDYLMGF